MNALMRGHGPGALCEICNLRPGKAVARTSCGLEAWSCNYCRGLDEEDDIEEARAAECREDAQRDFAETDGFSNGAINWEG